MGFISVDVETANSRLRSVCQVGLVYFENGEISDERSIFIDPREPFDGMNVSIHGINPEDVENSPTFPEVYNLISSMMRDQVVVSHTWFDRTALRQACDHHGFLLPSCRWLDSSRVVRRTWPQFTKSGYGLRNIADFCGLTFKHHDALEDARVAGLILLQAIQDSKIALDEWIGRQFSSNKSQEYRARSTVDAVSGGILFGERIVFTGVLSDMTRAEACSLAASLGASTDADVTRKTTMLVVGSYAPEVLKSKVSGKHQKVLNLRSQGIEIEILTEADFLSLARPE